MGTVNSPDNYNSAKSIIPIGEPVKSDDESLHTANWDDKHNLRVDSATDSSQQATEIDFDSPDSKATIDQLIEQIGLGKFQVILLVFLGINQMADAAEIILLSILTPIFHCQWQITTKETSLMTMGVFAGMLLGGTSLGSLGDQHGRKFALLMCTLMVMLAGMLTAMAPDFVWFLLLRGMTGFFLAGLIVTCTTAMCEFVPRQRRGSYVAWMNIFWATGEFLTVAFGQIALSLGTSWRILVLLAAIPSLLSVTTFFWLEESPRYLMSIGRHEEALRIINKIARMNGHRPYHGQLIDEAEAKALTDEATKLAASRAGKHYASTTTTPTNVVVADIGERGCCRHSENSLWDMFHPGIRQTTIMTALLWATAAFSYYGSAILSSKITHVEHRCLFDRQHWYDTASGTLNQMREGDRVGGGGYCCKPLTGSILRDLAWGICGEMVATVFLIFTIDRMMRRGTLAGLFLLSGVLYVLLDLCIPIVATDVLLFILRGVTAIVYELVQMYTAEIFPTTIRNGASGFCCSAARLGAMQAPIYGQLLLGKNTLATVLLFAAIMAVSALVSALLPVETNGRQLTEDLADYVRLWEIEQRDKQESRRERDGVSKNDNTNNNKTERSRLLMMIRGASSKREEKSK